MDGPVSERAPSIKAIDGRSVHQICSGQVILSLATAVKELVENSIDANAMNIEIKLKDYGMDTIDVLDNGSGIEEKDYEALGLKHYTSKLRDFSDLSVVDTFGFRGEALSSLCALSKLIVTTRHSSKEAGCKLDFDYDGKLTAKTPCAREKGTTVTISQLFHSLPVRHKEFKRNIKKEFSKLNLVLQAYGIISTGVKFNCVNSTEKNKKNIILSTGGGSLLENVTSIFGPKQVQSLLEFSQQSPSEEIAELFNISHGTAENMSIFKISGYISRADHGCGRSSLDRQFYFVNKRPCDLIKVARLVNEVYHIFNRSQYPFVVLDISLKSDLVDVNVTPDKRQLFMQHEKLLLAVLKTSLLKMFTDTAGQYTMNGAIGRGTLRSAIVSSQNGEANANKPSSPQEARDVERPLPSSVSRNVSQPASSILNKFRSRFCRDEIREQNCSERSIQTGMEKFTFKVPKEEIQLHTVTSPSESIESAGNCNTSKWNDAICFKDKSSKEDSGYTKVGERSDAQCNQLDLKECKKDIDEEEYLGEMSRDSHDLVNLDRVTIENSVTVIDSRNGTRDDPCGIDVSDLNFKGDPKCSSQSYNEAAIIEDDISSLVTLKTSDCCEEIRLHSNGDKNTGLERETHNFPKEVAVLDLKGEFPSENVVLPHLGKRPEKRKELEYSIQAQAETKRKKPRLENLHEFSSRTEVALPLSMCTLRQNFIAHPETDETARRDQLRGFRAKISPSQNSDAEEELRRNITKDMFRDMEILGQFNLGFIIAKLGQDLFIIDQHATDEKYNFERLQREHCLKGQKLIQPKSLELTAVSEGILIDNLEIFNKNGFDFMIDESKPATQRVKLVSLPTSKNWTFDVGDIEELIFMLSDTPGVVCRPSRVRSMFASRACRMSTMVGSPLNKSQMKKLVCHMADIEHPWNCPHGRPTMRHLVNLKRINTGTL